MSASTLTDHGILGEPQPLLPTIPGKVAGIVGWDPPVLQCHDCGATLTLPGKRNVHLILARWQFHLCEGRTGVRRCQECLAAVVAACPSGVCKR